MESVAKKHTKEHPVDIFIFCLTEEFELSLIRNRYTTWYWPRRTTQVV